MKRLEEIRDRLANEYSYRHAKRIPPEDSYACYVSGFDAAVNELMPMAEELVEVLDITVSELDQYSRGRRDQSFEGWQSQWIEVPIKHESDYEFYPNHIEKDFVESLRSKLFAWRKFKGEE